MPLPRFTASPLPLLALAVAAGFSCGRNEEPSAAEKARTKRAEDAELLALPYPQSTGALPASMEVFYDGATDRTYTTLRLADLPVGGRGAASVSSATLYLTSSHRGQERAPDDPEGSIDGRFVVRTSTPGALAFSGAPGAVLAPGGGSAPLRPAQDGEGYSSRRVPGGAEEAVAFRFPTADLVRAADAGAFTLSFGTVEVRVEGRPLADLREFAARLNPNPR